MNNTDYTDSKTRITRILRQRCEQTIRYFASLLCYLLPSTFYLLPSVYCAQSDAYYHYFLANIAEMKGDLPRAINEYKESILYDTESVYLKRNLANLYILTGNIKAASDVISKIPKNVPNTEPVVSSNQEPLVSNEQPDNIISAYKEMLSTESANNQTFYNLGILYSESMEYEKAILSFEKFLQSEPNSPDVYINIGILYQKLNEPIKAEAYLKKAVEIDNKSAVPLFALANFYEQEKNYDQSIGLYEKLVEILPDDAEICIKIARLYAIKQDYVLAKKYLSEAKKKFPKNQWVDYYFGLLAIDEKDYPTAIKHFNTSISIDKKFSLAYIQNGYVFTIQNNTKNAIKSFEKAVLLGEKSSDIYFFLAMNYEVLGKYKKAEIVLKKAIELEPQNAKYRFEMGVVFDKLKKSNEAEKEFFSVIEIDSTSANAYNYLGYWWADKNVKLDCAEEFVKKALEIEPQNPAYIDSLGWVYYRQAKYTEAISMLKKASEKMNDYEIFEHLGDCYLATGDIQRAVDSWDSSYTLVKNVEVKKKIKKYSNGLKWSKDMIAERAVRSFKWLKDVSGFVTTNTIFNSPFFFKKPKQLRLEILGLFSVSQGLIEMQDGTIVYTTPDKKRYDLTDELFWVKDIFNIFDAEFFDELIFLAEEKKCYVFKNDFVEVKVEKKQHLMYEVKFANGSVIELLDYSISDKVKFPHKLIFTSKNGDMKTTLILKKLKFNSR